MIMSEEEIMEKLQYLANFEMLKVSKIEVIEIINAFKSLQQKNKELENMNDKLSSALDSAEQRIDKVIKLLDDLYFGNFFCDEKPTKFTESKVGNELLSILKGKDVK